MPILNYLKTFSHDNYNNLYYNNYYNFTYNLEK